MAVRPGLLLLAGAGGVVLWSGIKGKSVTSVFRQLIGGDPPTTATNANPIVQTSPTSGGSESSSAPAGDTGAQTGSAATNQATARVLVTAMGYPQWAVGTQWNDLVSLWNQESGWNQFAQNPQSGAYGIPQALPPTKLPAAGQASGGSSPSAQMTWGIQYIAETYGSPSAAWDHEVSNGWY